MVTKEHRKEYNRKYMSLHRDAIKAYRQKHYTGLYGSWYAMKQRCGNPKSSSYKNYGGRGITYPEKWETFEGFSDDMGEFYKKGLTLERIDNNQSYSKENCRWATRKEQCSNMRKNVVIEYAGQKRTLIDWWKYLEMDISYNTLRQRFYHGMSPERILEQSGVYRPQKLATN